MGTTRKRLRLVPKKAVEVFEIRIAAYLDMDGNHWVNAAISDPDHVTVLPPEHEVIGVMHKAMRDCLPALYATDEED